MKIIEIKVSPENILEIGTEKSLTLVELAAKNLRISVKEIEDVKIIKKSLDARKKPVYLLRCAVSLHGEKEEEIEKKLKLETKDISKSTPVIIIGAGPAGLFAAIELVTLGLKPVIIERGKEVRDRRRDLAALMKKGILNADSNYCFGEGGAGTFSDGKLYTRSGKRGSINQILDLLVFFGASENILIDSHPHIGTNKLPKIITAIREYLISCGAEFYFSHTFQSFQLTDKKIKGIKTQKGDFSAPAVLLSSGHSARNVYFYLREAGIKMEYKGFAIGVRIEHPQEVINQMQYKSYWNSPTLPPASYQLVSQEEERGVYSFCMCPGGIICPASTDLERLVVNGWSPSSRNSKFANSGLVVEIPQSSIDNKNILSGIEYQDSIENSAYLAGGGLYKAPAQRVSDFILANSKTSNSLPPCSYGPGINSSNLSEVLPKEISNRLKSGLKNFIKKSPLYGSNDAIIVGVESRTSSPLRIPREENGMHPELEGLFPCGEGAGYAGGIVSAAIDGVNSARKIYNYYQNSLNI